MTKATRESKKCKKSVVDKSPQRLNVKKNQLAFFPKGKKNFIKN